MTKCNIINCNNKMIAHKLCSKHLTRFKRYGDVNYVKIVRGENRTKHPLYHTYNNMKKRCMNPNSIDFINYGGRGIKIADKWLAPYGFKNFSDYVGDRPMGMSLDRIDNNGNYEPGNVRWATRIEQNSNQRMKKNNKTGYRGVYENGYSYIARVARIHIGSYKDIEKAAVAYDCGAIQIYGESAITNII